MHENITGSCIITLKNLPVRKKKTSLTDGDKNKMVHLGKMGSVKDNDMITVTCLFIIEYRH